MFRSIWQRLRGVYMRRRSGIDVADIEHLRADLRFRLALVEYAYFGRSGKRVARGIHELKTLLGDKAVHRYLRSLDPDLRTQFVERFQGARRGAESFGPEPARRSSPPPVKAADTLSFVRPRPGAAPPSNVVPIDYAARKAGGTGPLAGPARAGRQTGQGDNRSADSGE